MESPAGSRILKLIVSPATTCPSVSMKHPSTVMSPVRAWCLPVAPSHTTSSSTGTRRYFLGTSLIVTSHRSRFEKSVGIDCFLRTISDLDAKDNRPLEKGGRVE